MEIVFNYSLWKEECVLIQNIAPPMVGATDLKSLQQQKLQEKDFKGSGSDSSFGRALQDKQTSSKDLKESVKQDSQVRDRQQDDDRPQAKSDEKVPEQKVAKPEGKITKAAANRQKAIKEFMDSFESEFEIPPTRLVEAMAKLDDSQLEKSPEETADAVIKQLGLDDAQADKARAMYVSLLGQLNQMQKPSPTAQAIPVTELPPQFGMTKQGADLRVAAAHERRAAIGSAVDQLNQKFWMRQDSQNAAPIGMAAMGPTFADKMMMDDSALAAAAAQGGAANLAELTEQMPEQGPKLEELPPHLQGQMKEAMAPGLLAALAAQRSANSAGGAEKSEQEDSQNLADEFGEAAQAPQAHQIDGKNSSQHVVEAKGAEQFFQQQGESQGQQSMMQNPREFMKQSLHAEKELAKGKLAGKASEFKAMSLDAAAPTTTATPNSLPMMQTTDALKFDPMAQAAAPAAGQAGASNQTENQAAVKQLMNQAQYLIRNGGGEMKVKMSPEGMGTIHMKVMLQDGKVNLQMSADTQEAKRTIESSLADLKTSLAAHKLSVENVKVDVVNNTSSDTAMKNQTDANGQREQARQFWNQFNENFGSSGKRDAFLDMQDVKGYGVRRDPLKPIEASSTTSTARTTGNKGSGLNLVA
jgi:flagellar hook-length control protein FliK